ncbi:PAS and ANTAR domain-containing protein [Nocardia sp. XZ_19_385]|uniref:PAS and ANTAR domain-containing protein n=1 Tax=Nocardia sp. XZ_19_385 TaxID=2769488 RepID=UPI00188E7541|nr:PAS and ANTAR domain-containing protein [Nocardia sp. XZ_19_385]
MDKARTTHDSASSSNQAADLASSDRHVLLDTGGPKVGTFRFWFGTRRWEWSPEIYLMHGYTPGEVEPTSDLLLTHKHPEDDIDVTEAITRALSRGEPFADRYRFLDTAGTEHQVMLVSDSVLDHAGVVVGTTGYYLDLGQTIANAERDALDAVIPDVIESRAAIEQAKGALMLIYSISAEQAFKVLIWRSQETNTKLRDIAEALIAAVPRIPPMQASSITAFDHLLLNIHQSPPPQR